MGFFDFLGDVVEGIGDLVDDAIDFVDDLLTDDSSSTTNNSSSSNNNISISSNSSNSNSSANETVQLDERDMVGFKSTANVYYDARTGAKYSLTSDISNELWWINFFDPNNANMAVLINSDNEMIKAKVSDLYYDPYRLFFSDSANVYYDAHSGAKYNLTDEIRKDFWKYEYDDPYSSKLVIISNSDGKYVKARISDLSCFITPFDDENDEDDYEDYDYNEDNYEEPVSDKGNYTKSDQPYISSKLKIGDIVMFNDTANVFYSISDEKLSLSSKEQSKIKSGVWKVSQFSLDNKTVHLVSTSDASFKIKAQISDLILASDAQKQSSNNQTQSANNQKGTSMVHDDNYNGYQFTALGLSGSGKTCFMAGMYYKMTGGVSGYTLKADDDDAVNLTAYYEQMTNAKSGADRFPGGTNQSTDYSFELQYGYKTLEKFRWVDYAGGTLKSKNTGDAEEYSKLKNDIAKSEMLYIFVDGGLFQDDELEYASSDSEKIETLTDIVMESCSRQINHFLSEYTSERKKLPPIAIVVTKYDLAVKALGKADNNENLDMLYKVIQRAFNPLFPDPSMYNGNDGHTSMVGIIPVSLGFKISEENYTGKLRPINMHMPAYVGIWFMLKSKNNNDTSVKRLADEIEDSGIKFWLNGQTGKFSTLAEGYLKNI